MFRILKYTLGGFVLLIAGLFWLAYLSPRPPLTIDPATLAGDGSQINYCELPLLDSSGLKASDIPKGNTPSCGYSQFLPVLRDCGEPLPAGADDIRGLWRAVRAKNGHIERVEQCGERVVVTAAGVIHDYGPNSTGGLNTNDTEGSVLFTAGGKTFACGPLPR